MNRLFLDDNYGSVVKHNGECYWLKGQSGVSPSFAGPPNNYPLDTCEECFSIPTTTTTTTTTTTAAPIPTLPTVTDCDGLSGDILFNVPSRYAAEGSLSGGDTLASLRAEVNDPNNGSLTSPVVSIDTDGNNIVVGRMFSIVQTTSSSLNTEITMSGPLLGQPVTLIVTHLVGTPPETNKVSNMGSTWTVLGQVVIPTAGLYPLDLSGLVPVGGFHSIGLMLLEDYNNTLGSLPAMEFSFGFDEFWECP